MNISNATASSIGAAVNNPQIQPPPPAPKSDKPQGEDSASVVKLSAQAQQMSHAESQNKNTERSQASAKEVAEPPGIQLLKGDSKGGRVDTFA